MQNIDRRTFMEGAVALALASGSTLLLSNEAEGARCPKLPRTARNKTLAPLQIRSETGVVVDGMIDLTTVRYSPTSRDPARIAFELFVDTYESGESVRTLTDKIEELALVNPELHRPETCLLTWGKSFQFSAIIEQVRVGFTMFLADGTPVRATPALDLQLQEGCTLP